MTYDFSRMTDAERALRSRGWISKGDLPYTFARELNKKAGTLASFVSGYARDVIAAQTAAYRAEHIQTIRGREWYSPDLVEKIRVRTKEERAKR